MASLLTTHIMSTHAPFWEAGAGQEISDYQADKKSASVMEGLCVGTELLSRPCDMLSIQIYKQ